MKIKKNWLATYKFKCASKIDETVQQGKILGFYKIDQNEKHPFIKKTTVCFTANSETNNMKKNSFTNFYFGKEFASGLKTLLLVYFGFIKKGQQVMPIKKEMRWIMLWSLMEEGRIATTTGLVLKRESVLARIEFFPAFDAYFDKANTNKEYLASGLKI